MGIKKFSTKSEDDKEIEELLNSDVDEYGLRELLDDLILHEIIFARQIGDRNSHVIQVIKRHIIYEGRIEDRKKCYLLLIKNIRDAMTVLEHVYPEQFIFSLQEIESLLDQSSPNYHEIDALIEGFSFMGFEVFFFYNTIIHPVDPEGYDDVYCSSYFLDSKDMFSRRFCNVEMNTYDRPTFLNVAFWEFIINDQITFTPDIRQILEIDQEIKIFHQLEGTHPEFIKMGDTLDYLQSLQKDVYMILE